MNLTDEQLHTLRHMLGINDRSKRVPEPYRDYYCANRGSAKMIELERLGAVRRYRQCERYDWYETTDAGRAAAIASAKARRMSKSKRRYSRFLDLAEVMPDLTFHQFLTDDQFAGVRAEA